MQLFHDVVAGDEAAVLPFTLLHVLRVGLEQVSDIGDHLQIIFGVALTPVQQLPVILYASVEGGAVILHFHMRAVQVGDMGNEGIDDLAFPPESLLLGAVAEDEGRAVVQIDERLLVGDELR